MSEQQEPSGPSEDAKAKFRAALDRKKQQQAQARPGGAAAQGSIHGAHDKAGAKREFRRKSGG